MGKTVNERFDEKVLIDEVSGCWIWTAGKYDYGYGKFSINGKTLRAHRIAYERFVGPIPDGLELDHLCEITACVCPAHLEPVTHRVNILRGRGVAAKNAAKTHCIRGHPLSGENLITRSGGGRGCRECGRIYGLFRYKENREHLIERARIYREENRDLIREKSRAKYATKKETK